MKTLIKKTLLVLMVAFIAVFTLGVSSKVKAAEEVYKTLTFTSTTMQSSVNGYSNSWQTKCDGDTWNISNANNFNKTWTYIRMGSKNAAYVGSIATAFAINKEVTKVVMTVDKVTASNINSIKLYVATDANFSNVVETVSVNAATGALSFKINSPVINAFYKIAIDCKKSSNGIIQVSKVEYYADSASAGSPTISINGDSYAEVQDEISMEAVLSNLTGDVVWTSSTPEVASVDQSGNVTALSMGTTTIVAAVGEVKATQEFKVYPTDGSELTIADAIEVCKLTGTNNCPFTYSTSGTIKSIDTEYDSDYNNITVTITDGTNSIQAYRMKEGSELQVEQKIKVTGALVNYDGDTPEFAQNCTYELVVDDTTADILEALNSVKASMSLAYKYTCVDKEVAVTTKVSDVLNLALTGVSGTKYGAWSGKTVTTSAVWAGQSAGDNDSIQLRSKNNNSGIVTTSSGGKVSKVIIKWNSATANGRTLDVYGSNTAYSNPTDLYNDSTSGEKLGSIVYGTSTELEISGDYAYIGLRSNDGAMYITSIEVVWAVEGEGTTTEMGYEDVDFRIKCGVDKALGDIKGVDSYGIKVTADKEMELSATGKDEDYLFAVISLGDVLTNAQRLDVVFTVQAYVVIGDVTYVSESTKSFSVRQMVEAYYADAATTDLVASLYNLITE